MATGLGIESTAHTLGIGIVRDGKILANVKEMYTTEQGGIIPIESAKHHEKVFDKVLESALDISNLSLENLDFISVANAPGLAPCLLVGLRKAKELALKFNLPLVKINHCISHLEIGGITGCKDPVLLYASGANTQIIAYEAGKYRIFGETLDIGIGNFIDNFARYLGIGFPGGPKIQELAKGGKYIELPYTVKGMDMAFSGILTKLKQLYEKGEKKQDLAFSLQETVFAMLIEAAERALAHTGKKELLLGGGVGCNSRLQEMCKIMCEERGCKFFVPERPLLVDNGAMIGYLGEIMFKKGIKVEGNKIDKIDIDPKERTDMVDVRWR